MPDPLEFPAPQDLAAQLVLGLPDFGHVGWVAETDSSNAELLNRARAQGASEARPWLRGAHRQRSARGRAGRAWQNTLGACLMFSCAFDTRLQGATLPSLSPLIGLATCESLRALAGDQAGRLQVKWPNDLQLDDAKLAGVLVETVRNGTGAGAGQVVVIGIGINLTGGTELSQTLQRPIADWARLQATAALPDLIAAMALAWQSAIGQLESAGFDRMLERYARVDALAGQCVDVLDQGRLLHRGHAGGLDGHGRLLVHTAAGCIPIAVGEVSVRKP